MKSLASTNGYPFQVSDVDFEFLSQFTWCHHFKGYFYGRNGVLRDKSCTV